MDVLKLGATNPKLKTMNLDRLLKEAQFHGSNRIAGKKYRLVWCFILAIMLWASLSILGHTVHRFLQQPTFMAQKPTHKQDIPIPSLAICAELSYPDYKMDAFVKEINYPSGVNALSFRKNLRQLAAFYSPDVEYNVEDLKMLQTVLHFNNLEVENTGQRLTPTCEEIVLRFDVFKVQSTNWLMIHAGITFVLTWCTCPHIKCRLMGKMKNCTDMFEMMLTRSGFCCVFNGRSLRGEMTHNTTSRHHYYFNFSSPTSGLMTVVNTSQEHNNIDLTYKWVIIESGQYYAESMMNGTPLAASKELWLGYAWTTFSINDHARNLKQNLRQCRLSTEVLDYFPVYGRWYCHVECEMARTLSLCQCLRVTHPQLPGTSICDAASLNCTKRAAVVFGSNLCTCPSTCDDHISYYKVQTYDLSNKYHLDYFYDDLDFERVSVVRAYILTQNLKEYSREAYFNKVNLFSQLGGIISVFFGCSILTSLEIMQIVWCVIKNVYYSRQVKIQELPPGKLKTKSPRNKNKKQKTLKFAGNQEEFTGTLKQTRTDTNRLNILNNFKVWPILVLVPSLEQRNNF